MFVDGGIRRGSDMFKCLCLGAKAVGVGRSFLYSLVYGEEGVGHLVDVLRDELETSMRLVGVRNVAEAGNEYVNTRGLDGLVPESLDGLETRARAKI